MEKKIDKRKIDIIREHRTIEATKKLYMGFGGKICCIARNLGDTIWQEGGRYYEESFMPDMFAEESDILTADIEAKSYPIGWLFNGLSRGIHMEIKYLDFRRELAVRYKGHIVYLEVNNELEGYNPFDEWEEKINDLYPKAKKLEKKNYEKDQNLRKEANSSKNNEILRELKEKWGL